MSVVSACVCFQRCMKIKYFKLPRNHIVQIYLFHAYFSYHNSGTDYQQKLTTAVNWPTRNDVSFLANRKNRFSTH